MKRIMLLMLAVCFMLTGCGKTDAGAADTQLPEKTTVEPEAKPEPAVPAAKQEPSITVKPLPDTTMEELNDSILSVSLKEGDAYVDDTGKMQMAVKIYSYDKYDLAHIAELKVSDTIVTHAGEVKISTLERGAGGVVIINGGLEAGGIELVTDGGGIFYETGFNDAKNWYEVGEATIRVSVDFLYYDRSDPERGDVIFYPGSFLVGEVTDYHFVPHNTTIRVENGQIVEMIRTYVP
jgi:hypothetical protein